MNKTILVTINVLLLIFLLFNFPFNIFSSTPPTLQGYLEQNDFDLPTIFDLYLKCLDEGGIDADEIEFLNLLFQFSEEEQENYGKEVFKNKGVTSAIIENMNQAKSSRQKELEIEDEKILQVIHQFASGFVKKDVNQILSCCHDPILLNHYSWDHAYMHPLSSYRVSLKKMFKKSNITKDKFINITTAFNGSEARVKAIEEIESQRDLKTFNERNKVILVLVKDQNGFWKISKYSAVEPM